jgi:hypothetical protein
MKGLYQTEDTCGFVLKRFLPITLKYLGFGHRSRSLSILRVDCVLTASLEVCVVLVIR